MSRPINAEPERCQAYQRPGTLDERPCQSAGRHTVTVDGRPLRCCAAHANGARKGSTRWQPLTPDGHCAQLRRYLAGGPPPVAPARPPAQLDLAIPTAPVRRPSRTTPQQQEHTP